MKNLFFKYVITTIVVILAIIGIYYYAGTREKKQNYSLQEYKIENAGMKKMDNLRLCIVDIDTINPINSLNQNVQDIGKIIFEPLLEIDENYKIELCLAKEWAKINQTQYLIKLKEGITWHDGTIFKAQDVKYTIDKIKENNNSIYYSNVKHINEILIIDDTTIKINLDMEVPFFEYQLTFPIISSSSQDANNLIGTGKYQIIKYENQSITLEEYPNWWNINENDTIIKKINIYIYDSIATAYQKFKEGEIDILTTSNFNIEDYIGSVGFYSKQFPDRQYDFIACNTENLILSQKEVRQAIMHGINKQEIINTIYNGKYKIANLPLDYGSYLNINQEKDNYQPETAKQILKQAGWEEKDGYWQLIENGKTIKLQLNLTVCEENEQRLQVAEMLKNQLEQIGIPINLNLVSLKQYNQCIQNKEYELLLAGMQTSLTPDLNGYLGEGNLSNFKNEETFGILSDVKNITEESMLKQKYKRMMEILQEEAPYIGLYFHTKTFIYQKNLKGNINPTAYQLFYHMNTWYRQD